MVSKYILAPLCAAALLYPLELSAQAPQAAAQTAAAAESARSGPLPVGSFARIPFIAQARLAPDGSAIAGLMGIDGKQAISVLNPFDHKDRPIYLRVPEGTQVAWLRWVNKDNLLVGLYALLPIEGGERAHISRLLSVHRPSGKISKILWDRAGQDAAEVVWVASDGSPTVLVAAQNSVYLGEEFWPAVWRVNVESGKRSLALKGRDGVMDWYADAAGNVRAGVGYLSSSKTFKLLYRDPGQGNFSTVDKADTRRRESLARPFLFLPGTSRALAIHDNDQGRATIYEIDLKTQQDVRTVFAAPGGGEVDQIFASPDGTALLGAGYSGNSSGIVWFDPALAEIQAEIDKSVPGRRARIVSLTDDRKHLLILIDRPESPGAIYYFDIAGGMMRLFAQINAALGTKPLAPVRMVQYTARDGLKIEGVLTLPPGRAHKNLPIVLLPHGGPWGHDTLDYDYWAQFIASRGYAVLQPNFRGSTGYGTEFMRAGEGQLGLKMQDDISDGLAWAVKEGLADPARACIVGGSYGGYAAMWGIAKDPELYRCAVSIAGVANLRREVNDFGSYLMGGMYRDSWQRMTPDFAAVSPINAVDRIKAPLLLVHGKKDITVDAGQSTSMASKMRGAGKPVELVVLPEADHGFTREADRVTLLTALESFLLRHNPPDAPAAASRAAAQ